MFHRCLALPVATLCVALVSMQVVRAAGAAPMLVTVDDLPIASRLHVDDEDERVRVTRALLDALGAHGIRAVGLVTWKNVLDTTDRRLLEMWVEAGHELGNHTALHKDINDVSAEAYIADIERGRVFLTGLLEPFGTSPRYFRFTYLHEGDTEDKVRRVRAYLQESGQRPLPATIHTRDWSFELAYLDALRERDDEARARVLARYQESLRAAIRRHTAEGARIAGDAAPQILLLHANAIGADGWDALFSWIRREGFRFAPAGEVLAHPLLADFAPRPTTRSFSHWERLADRERRQRAEREVRQLLDDQARAWSRGDLEAFMGAYAEDVVFVTPSGLTRGRNAVLERYRTRYPDRAAMGTLTLEILETRIAAGHEATAEGDATPSRVHGVSVVARWTLSYPGDTQKNDASGLTLLVLHPGDGGWRILQDASM